MRKIFFSAILVFGMGLLVMAQPTKAAVRCETQYGGKEVCVRTGKLQVNKEVFDPRNKKFVDNLGLNDHKFSPGEQVVFKVKIKNVGDNALGTITVLDILPDLLKTDGNPQFQIKDLKVGEEKEQEIKVKVAGADKFPKDKSVLCVVNAAEAQAGDDKDRDAAQLCLERKVLPQKGAPVLPPTGPEHTILFTVLSLLALTSGIYLVRVNKR